MIQHSSTLAIGEELMHVQGEPKDCRGLPLAGFSTPDHQDGDHPLLMLKLGLAGLAVAVSIAMILSYAETGRPPTNEPATSSAVDAQHSRVPALEAELLSAARKAADRENSALNDIARRDGRAVWEREVCSTLSNSTISEWAGTLKTITGEGGYVVSLGDGVELEGTSQRGDALYRQLRALREGTDVVVSGRFVPTDGCRLNLIGFPLGNGRVLIPAFDVELTAIFGPNIN